MIVNASIQVVPLTEIENAIPLIDKAIAIIQQSNINYAVGAVETTLEGEYEDVQKLIKQVEDLCYSQKEIQFLVYKKLHVCGGNDILISGKTSKFNFN